MTSLTLFATVTSAALAFFALYINPFRLSNKALFLLLLTQSAWLYCIYNTIKAGHLPPPERIHALDYWFHLNGVIVSIIPAFAWFLTNSILFDRQTPGFVLRKATPVIPISLFLVYLSTHQTFSWQSSPDRLSRGVAYALFIIVFIAFYTILLIIISRKIGRHTGIQKIELQFLALNATGSSLLIGILNALGNISQERALNRLSICVLLIASTVVALALLFHRVFNAREVIIRLGQRASFIAILSGSSYWTWSMLHDFLPEPIGLLISVASCSSAALWLERASSVWFGGAGRRKLEAMRKAVIELGQSEVQVERLVERFENLLQSETGARLSVFLFDHRDSYEGGSLKLSRNRPGFAALTEMGWTTPESLMRRRPSDALADLQEFVEANSLGLVISTPKGSPTPSVVIALGRRADGSPFTYPEVERLQNLATLMDNLLSRSRRAAHAAIVARMEFLALASRGLAHDLKNLITPVSSFLIHTEGTYPPESPAGEVHATARQATEAMSNYVRESLFFAEKLTPRIERFRVPDLIREVLAAAEPQAKSRHVRIVTGASTDAELSADRVLLVRMLINLVSNAVEASASESEVMVTARQAQKGAIRFEVLDHGSGIAPEHVARIFDPYFTTKEFGSELRGFGLGLTIAQKIVLVHGGDISLSSRPGSGTTFTVDIPDARIEPSLDRVRSTPVFEPLLPALSPATP